MTMIEVLTRDVPLAHLPAFQVAAEVVRTNLRPSIPSNCPTSLAELLQQCWAQNPEERPEFSDIYERLNQMTP